MALPQHSIAELRAIVGDDGADWSDEQLLAAAAHAQQLGRLIVEMRLDRLNPAAARRREEARRATQQVLLDKRRRRYGRELAARERKRAERRSA